MSFKNHSDVVSNIKYDEQFKFTDTAATLVGNRQFLQGYYDSVNNIDNAAAHIWNAISAVADDIGNTIYTNIQNYIDMVSNVDLCRISGLKSMIKFEGVDYNLFDTIDFLPTEILQTMDIMSIDRKLLLSNPHFNAVFRNDLAESILSIAPSAQFVNEVSSDGNLSVDVTYISDDKFYDYLSTTYLVLLSGFLALEYNVTKYSDNDRYYAYPSLNDDKSFDVYRNDDSRQYKVKSEIDLTFNEQAVVDAIEAGYDSIANYDGAQLALIYTEMAKRQSRLQKTDLVASSKTPTFDLSSYSFENKTRYSYYVRRKVYEYFDFINSKYYFDSNQYIYGKVYAYDPNYLEMHEAQSISSCISFPKDVADPQKDFNWTMLSSVADSLTKTTLYISSLRQQIKKQVRKNYMKGTNNLLIYIINQYLIGYSQNMTLDAKYQDSLSSVYKNLGNNSVKDIAVVEYYDKTEYYNLSTDTTRFSDRNDANNRFWSNTSDYSSFKKDGISFALSQIEHFYLSSMLMKNGLSSQKVFDDFLDTVYSTGAHSGYYDPVISAVGTTFLDGQTTREVYDHYNAVSAASDYIRQKFDDLPLYTSSLSSQLNSAYSSYYDQLHAEVFSDVSSTYDDYSDQVKGIQASIESLESKCDQALQSISMYDNYENLQYGTIYDRLVAYRNFSKTNIHSTQLINAVDSLLTMLSGSTTSTNWDDKVANLSSAILVPIINSLTAYSYVNPNLDTIDGQLDSMETFINQQLPTANSTTKDKLNRILGQIYECRTTYNDYLSSLLKIINSDKYLEITSGFSLDSYISKTTVNALKDHISIFDSNKHDEFVAIITELEEEYYDIETTVFNVGEELRHKIGYSESGMTIEQQSQNIANALRADVNNRFIAAKTKFETEIKKITDNLQYLSVELMDSLSADISFDDAIRQHLSSLDYKQYPEYRLAEGIYLTYSGNTFSYYPYYNMKNTSHPSYQIHPYLWNFIEKTPTDVINIDKLYSGIDLADLEMPEAIDTIDDYIGKWGNSINIWNHPGALDYSGYITNYEQHDHRTEKSVLTCEVAGYDGPFYPPAIDMLKANYKACIDSLSSQSGEFFDRFYKPLVLTQSELKYVIDQYEEYYKSDDPSVTTIDQITSPRHKFNIYDIYKYGVDTFDNKYTLYKQYFDKSPSYRTKRNTLGELWIRLKDHPVSFPALAGKHPILDLTQVNSVPVGIKRLTNFKPGIGYVSGRMRQFFDFEINSPRTSIALVSFNPDTNYRIREIPNGHDDSYLSCYVMRPEFGYENPWIIGCPIARATVDDRQTFSFMAIDESKSAYTSTACFIRSGVTGYPTNITKTDISKREYSIENYAFIGMYSPVTTPARLRCVYVKKRYSNTGTSICIDGKNISLIDIDKSRPQGLVNILENSDKAHIPFDCELDSDDVCFTTDQYDNIVFAALAKITKSAGYAESTSSYVDVLENSDGPVFLDPRMHVEMTSHDIFDSNVILVRVQPDSGAAPRGGQNNLYNLNADMAFTPAYPGLSGEFHDRQTLMSSDSHLQIQLMGKSKNLDWNKSLINPNADPYFDVTKIYEEYRFGRVYEDYLSSYDKSIRVVSNPLVTDRINNDAVQLIFDVTDTPIEYHMSISVDGDEFGYTDRNFDKSKLMVFNSDTAGKNPYWLGDLTSLYVDDPRSDTWFDVEYNAELGINDISETEISGLSGNYTVAGTYTQKKRNRYDSNYLFNIRSVKMRFLKYDLLGHRVRTLQCRFIIDKPEWTQYTHIDKNLIKFVFFNTHDLEVFKYYHYLDAYGAVNARSAKYNINTVQNLFVEPWRVIYNYPTTPEDTHDRVVHDISSYYMYKNSEYRLADVDLSQYDYLSDVYILQGNDKLSFKVDEEDFWGLSSSLYGYPVLNINYPKILADYINDFNPYTRLNGHQLQYMRVLNDTNCYVFDFLDPDDLANKLGTIDIPLMMHHNKGYRVYENMMDKDTELGLYNFEKYAGDDVRNIEYLHFAEHGYDSTQLANDIAELSTGCATIPELLDKLTESGYSDLKILQTHDNRNVFDVTYERRNITSANVDISEFVKLYVNYKRDKSGITLYFNYYNYLDTPFVKIKENKIYSDIIPSTYLELKPDEDGILDIVIQVKKYVGGKIYGYTNIKLMTFQIFNVSTDKPKFIIRAVDSVRVGSYDDMSNNLKAKVTLSPIKIDAVTTGQGNTRILGTSTLDIITSTSLSSTFAMDIVYPSDVFNVNIGSGYGHISYVKSHDDEGYSRLTIESSHTKQIKLDITVPDSKIEAAKAFMSDQYLIYLDQFDIRDEYGRLLDVETFDSSIEMTPAAKLAILGQDT